MDERKRCRVARRLRFEGRGYFRFYCEGRLTLKQAADLAEMGVWDFLHELGKRKVSFTNIGVEDLREELEEVDCL